MKSFKPSNMLLALAMVLAVMVLDCQAQTLTYSAGWVNGKRSDTPATYGHHATIYDNSVQISDQFGRNLLCFYVNPQLKDTLISFGLKSPDFARTSLPRPMQLLRNHGEE